LADIVLTIVMVGSFVLIFAMAGWFDRI